MRRHASSYFPVFPQKILAQIALDEQDRDPWACWLNLWDFPKTPCATVHVDEPMIVVFPRQCRISIAGMAELAVRPMWRLSFRTDDQFTVHFSNKDGSFVTARWTELRKLARQR
jgi:hypothetical protein